MATLTRVELGTSARAALPDADYSDAFRTESPAFFPAEDWARAAFERAGRRGVLAQQSLWRGVLQLRLGTYTGAGRLAGWEVLDRAPGRLVLGATGPLLEGRIVFEAARGSARVTTLVRYRNPAGRTVWAAVAPLHRRAAPDILAAAGRRLSQSG